MATGKRKVSALTWDTPEGRIEKDDDVPEETKKLFQNYTLASEELEDFSDIVLELLEKILKIKDDHPVQAKAKLAEDCKNRWNNQEKCDATGYCDFNWYWSAAGSYKGCRLNESKVQLLVELGYIILCNEKFQGFAPDDRRMRLINLLVFLGIKPQDLKETTEEPKSKKVALTETRRAALEDFLIKKGFNKWTVANTKAFTAATKEGGFSAEEAEAFQKQSLMKSASNLREEFYVETLLLSKEEGKASLSEEKKKQIQEFLKQKGFYELMRASEAAFQAAIGGDFTEEEMKSFQMEILLERALEIKENGHFELILPSERESGRVVLTQERKRELRNILEKEGFLGLDQAGSLAAAKIATKNGNFSAEEVAAHQKQLLSARAAELRKLTDEERKQIDSKVLKRLREEGYQENYIAGYVREGQEKSKKARVCPELDIFAGWEDIETERMCQHFRETLRFPNGIEDLGVEKVTLLQNLISYNELDEDVKNALQSAIQNPNPESRKTLFQLLSKVKGMSSTKLALVFMTVTIATLTVGYFVSWYFGLEAAAEPNVITDSAFTIESKYFGLGTAVEPEMTIDTALKIDSKYLGLGIPAEPKVITDPALMTDSEPVDALYPEPSWSESVQETKKFFNLIFPFFATMYLPEISELIFGKKEKLEKQTYIDLTVVQDPNADTKKDVSVSVKRTDTVEDVIKKALSEASVEHPPRYYNIVVGKKKIVTQITDLLQKGEAKKVVSPKMMTYCYIGVNNNNLWKRTAPATFSVGELLGSTRSKYSIPEKDLTGFQHNNIVVTKNGKMVDHNVQLGKYLDDEEEVKFVLTPLERSSALTNVPLAPSALHEQFGSLEEISQTKGSTTINDNEDDEGKSSEEQDIQKILPAPPVLPRSDATQSPTGSTENEDEDAVLFERHQEKIKQLLAAENAIREGGFYQLFNIKNIEKDLEPNYKKLEEFFSPLNREWAAGLGIDGRLEKVYQCILDGHTVLQNPTLREKYDKIVSKFQQGSAPKDLELVMKNFYEAYEKCTKFREAKPQSWLDWTSSFFPTWKGTSQQQESAQLKTAEAEAEPESEPEIKTDEPKECRVVHTDSLLLENLSQLKRQIDECPPTSKITLVVKSLNDETLVRTSQGYYDTNEYKKLLGDILSKTTNAYFFDMGEIPEFKLLPGAKLEKFVFSKASDRVTPLKKIVDSLKVEDSKLKTLLIYNVQVDETVNDLLSEANFPRLKFISRSIYLDHRLKQELRERFVSPETKEYVDLFMDPHFYPENDFPKKPSYQEVIDNTKDPYFEAEVMENAHTAKRLNLI